MSLTAVYIVGNCHQLATQPLMVSHPRVVETADLKLAPDADVAAASWIKPRLTGAFGAVTRHVPEGYAAYARVCHPVEDDAGQQVNSLAADADLLNPIP